MKFPATLLPTSLAFTHRRPPPGSLNREGFGQYAQSYLGGRLRADIQTRRHANTLESLFVHAAFLEELQNRLASLLAPQQSDVRSLGLQDDLEYGDVVFVIVRCQDDES